MKVKQIDNNINLASAAANFVAGIKQKKWISPWFKRRLKNSLPLYVLMLPAIIYAILLDYIPMYGLQIAFRDFSPAGGITGSEWVGLFHFKTFFESAQFWTLLRNTLTLNAMILMTFPIPILLAMTLNYCVVRRFAKSVQMITYAPHFISVVVLVGIIKIFFSPSMGVVNKIIELFGFQAVNFLIIPEYFKWLYVGSDLWASMGWNSVIYIGALTAISYELHEAAIIDGATKLQRIIYIDIPGIAPTIIVLFIMRIGHVMNMGFQKAFLMQNDAILPVSEVISTYVYKVGLVYSQFSYSTAIGLFNTLINVAMLIIANKIAKKVSNIGLF